MDLYNTNGAVEIHYPLDQPNAQHLASELAGRLDELVNRENLQDPLDSAHFFNGKVVAGIPNTDIEAIYIGRPWDWETKVPYWSDENDFCLKVVSGSNCLNQNCTGNELHIIAREYNLLLRAISLALFELGYYHFLPNGEENNRNLWVIKKQQTILSINADWVWLDAVDHLMPNAVGLIDSVLKANRFLL